MNSSLISIFDDPNNQGVPTGSNSGQEPLTPERIYKGFEEWQRLGRQDPTEPSTQPKSPDNSSDKKEEHK